MSTSGSDLIPEKFAMYFSSMNSLASKIYADIEGVEDYIKSHGPASINYSEKCSIVDKFLIYDHLKRNDAGGRLNRKLTTYQKYHYNKSETSLNSLQEPEPGISETELVQPVYYNDTVLDQDHESLLLTSVAPKKPEKYVYDDNNYWVDEHSVPYSGCTQTQAKACKLQTFLDSLPPPTQVTRKYDTSHKYRAPPIPTMRHNVAEHDDDDAADPYIIKPEEKGDRYSRIDKMDMERENDRNSRTSAVGGGGGGASASSQSIRVPLFGGLMGDDQQGPEVMKKSQKKEEGGSNEEDLPNQVQNKDLIAELQAKLKKGNNKKGDGACHTQDGISPRSSTKLNKPKAPPPPPPGSVKHPGGAVKVSKKGSDDGKSQSGKEAKSNATGKSLEREISDDFVVDVSSPCKIATKKTGLDFLDNW